MAKRPRNSTENNMTDLNTIDPLADLGLDAVAATEVVAEVASSEEDMARKAAPVENDDDMDFDDIEIGTATEVPTARRLSGGSKFPFAKLAAPAEGNIATFFVPYKASYDEKKFRRSVQSATTQANRTGATEGKYFESRSVTEAGVFKGIAVYRTDNRPEVEATDAEDAS